MFEKQINKLIEIVGDEKKALDYLGIAVVSILVLCVVILYIVWRPHPVSKPDNLRPIPGSQATQE